ncbi:glycosyl hydrolase [Aspergillus carlsbadensis]|nr:glycosyl hydrolase [Aspergillus carlsbadensis]
MSSTTALQVFPGATWTSSDGRHIQAHGGGIIKVGSTFYWHGEDKTQGTGFHNITCYSSTDLVQWHREGSALTQQQSGDLGPDRIVERPKVVFNKQTSKYVMFLHIDVFDYLEGRVGVATCDTVDGCYEYLGSFHPLGYESRDMGVFVDDDEKGYLICEDRPNGIHIFELSEDYLAVTKQVHLFPEHLESPAMIKRDGLYYLFASGLTYWFANDNLYTTAPSLSGPWAEWRMFAKPASATYSSQVTFILPIGRSALYMGDRWQYPGLPRSTYVWLPLEIDGRDVRMDNPQSFSINVATGAMAVPRSSRLFRPRIESGEGRGRSGDLAAFVLEVSAETEGLTVALCYTVAGEDEKGALVVIEGCEVQRSVAFLGNSSAEKQGFSVVHWRERFSKGQHRLKVFGIGSKSEGLDIRGAVICSSS